MGHRGGQYFSTGLREHACEPFDIPAHCPVWAHSITVHSPDGVYLLTSSMDGIFTGEHVEAKKLRETKMPRR